MRRFHRHAAILGLAAALFALGACASGSSGDTDGAEPRASDGGTRTVERGEAVGGNTMVTWKNLDPRNPDVTWGLVNESSEMGQKLRSGRASSTEIRVMSDTDMGTLINELRKAGFFENATRGLGLANVPDVPGRKGIVVVSQDGVEQGLMLTPNLGGTSIPVAYRDSKQLIGAVHGALQGFEVRVNQDADRVFQAPPIRMRTR